MDMDSDTDDDILVELNMNSIVCGNISSDFEQTNYLGSPFEVHTGDTILVKNQANSLYHWFVDTVILKQSNGKKYLFDLEDYQKFRFHRQIPLDNVQLIMNMTTRKREYAARVIQKAFKKYKAALLIQQYALAYVYRPGGALFKKRKLNFENTIQMD
jgi:hypothetical protein